MSPSDDAPSDAVTAADVAAGVEEAASAQSEVVPAEPAQPAAPRPARAQPEPVQPVPAPREPDAVVAGERHTATGSSTGQRRAHLTSNRRRIALRARSDHRPSQS